MLDRILQNFTWKDWCSKWELTYAFFHTFPTSFFPRSKLKFFHGLSVSVFFPEGLGPRGFRHLAVAQYRCAWRRLDPGNLSQTVQGGTWGMVNLNQIRRDDIPIYIYIYNIYNIYIYTPPRMQLWYRKVLLGIPAIPDLAFWVRVTSKICPIGNWHYPLSAGTSAKLPGGGGTGEYPCISSCRA